MSLQKYKRDSDLSYALGATLVAELLKTKPDLITRVYLRPDKKHGADLTKILEQLEKRHIEIIESTKAFNIQKAKDNCLLMAEFKKPQQNLDDAKAHVVLVNPSDAGNLGTIMRSCAAFGFNNLAIITPAVDAYDPKTIRSSMGALFHLNLEFFSNFDAYLAKYPRTLFSFQLDKSATKLADIKTPTEAYALVLGNEATGLPKDFAAHYGAKSIFIPQSDQVDSLNLSVATSIALYHFANH